MERDEAGGIAQGAASELVVDATVTVERAAQFLNISRGLAYAAARDGSLPTIRIGRRLLVPTARLRVMLGMPDGSDAPQEVGSIRGSADAS